MRFRRIKEEQILMWFVGKVLAYSAPDALLSLELQDGKNNSPMTLVCIPSRINFATEHHPFVLVYALHPARPHKNGEVLAIYPTTMTGKDFAKIRLDFAKMSAD